MKEASSTSSSGRFGWFPELLQLGPRRIGARVRLLGPAMLVGIIAGLGAVAFYVATQALPATIRRHTRRARQSSRGSHRRPRRSCRGSCSSFPRSAD